MWLLMCTITLRHIQAKLYSRSVAIKPTNYHALHDLVQSNVNESLYIKKIFSS